MTKRFHQDTGDREEIQLWVDDTGYPGQVKRDDAQLTWPLSPSTTNPSSPPRPRCPRRPRLLLSVLPSLTHNARVPCPESIRFQLLWAPTAAWQYDTTTGPDPETDEAAALAIEEAVMEQAQALSFIDVTSLADGAWTDTFQRGEAAVAVPNCCLSFILQNESLDLEVNRCCYFVRTRSTSY